MRWGQDICQPHALVESMVTVHTSSLKFHSPWHGHHSQWCTPGLGPGCTFGVSRQGPSFYQPSTGASQGSGLGPLLLSTYCIWPCSSAHMVLFYYCCDTQLPFHPDKIFNCSWSSQATKPFITTDWHLISGSYHSCSKSRSHDLSWADFFLSSRAASPDSASEKSAHSCPDTADIADTVRI